MDLNECLSKFTQFKEFSRSVAGRGGKGRGRPLNDEKVCVREMLKSAIESVHWKVALK